MVQVRLHEDEVMVAREGTVATVVRVPRDTMWARRWCGARVQARHRGAWWWSGCNIIRTEVVAIEEGSTAAEG